MGNVAEFRGWPSSRGPTLRQEDFMTLRIFAILLSFQVRKQRIQLRILLSTQQSSTRGPIAMQKRMRMTLYNLKSRSTRPYKPYKSFVSMRNNRKMVIQTWLRLLQGTIAEFEDDEFATPSKIRLRLILVQPIARFYRRLCRYMISLYNFDLWCI